jgi:hypothetical protein
MYKHSFDSKSNSWIYLYIVLNKNCKNYWCKQSFTGLCPQDRCSSWGLILILVVDHLCSNFIFIIWYLCSNMSVFIMGINPVEKYNIQIYSRIWFVSVNFNFHFEDCYIMTYHINSRNTTRHTDENPCPG